MDMSFAFDRRLLSLRLGVLRLEEMRISEVLTLACFTADANPR